MLPFYVFILPLSTKIFPFWESIISPELPGREGFSLPRMKLPLTCFSEALEVFLLI